MMKRLLDFAGSLAGLVLTSPLLLLVALAVKATSRGPVFYRAQRIGRGGTSFTMYKFRSMAITGGGPAVTRSGDPRVTAVGRLLRTTKIDEIPQLLNVLRGEMSLVGPRPEDPRYVELYTEEQRAVLRVRPGMTGAAALEYSDEEALLTGPDWEHQYRNVIMPAKLGMELEYLRRQTWQSDLGILSRTLRAMIRHRQSPRS